MIYWDYNAAAPLRPEVAALLAERLRAGHPANPASVHAAGRAARERLDGARERLARVLGCSAREVCFTASGAEADALALKGLWLGAAQAQGRRRVVTSAIEHPALLAAAAQLEQLGAPVVRVAPGPDGRVAAEALLAALTPDTLLCSLMWANNETGVVQPVAAVGRACRERGILFHTDAVQAAGRVPVSLREVDADLLSLSAHKLGGPAGVGALVVRRGVALWPLTPGHQEGGRRGGTPEVAACEAMALALERADREQPAEALRLARLRQRFEREVRARLPDVAVNGEGAERLANTANLRFAGADGEALLIALDLEGICVASGAACASGSLTPSHVLVAMGLSAAEARASLRFSLGYATQEGEVERVLEALVRHVPRTRP